MDESLNQDCPRFFPAQEVKPLKEIERSLITTFRKPIWSRFVKSIKEFQLIQPGDKIGVAISGGKDSLLMAKLFQELKRNGIDNFELEFIAMDPGYHPDLRRLLEENCRHLNIPVQLFSAQIFKVVDELAREYPCFLCAKMRRGALYEKARSLGCNKLALGHHFNDAIETTLLNLFYGGSFKAMMPKLKATNFEGMELIRPLYQVEEAAILAFIEETGLTPLNCACMVAAEKIGSKRKEIKALIQQLKGQFPDLDKLIYRAAQNVNLDCVLGWQKEGKRYSFLDQESHPFGKE